RRRQLAIGIQQPHGVGEDGRGLAQQRIRALLGGVLARGVERDVAFVRGQAVVVGEVGQRVEVQAQALALLLPGLALRGLAIALGAALGLVERDVVLLGLGAELGHVLLPPL